MRAACPTQLQDLTKALLPQAVRERFGFSYGLGSEREIHRNVALLHRLYLLLPTRLRNVGRYQEAKQRLAGRCVQSVLDWSGGIVVKLIVHSATRSIYWC